MYYIPKAKSTCLKYFAPSETHETCSRPNPSNEIFAFTKLDETLKPKFGILMYVVHLHNLIKSKINSNKTLRSLQSHYYTRLF